MKKLLVLILIAIAGKFGWDRFNAQKADQDMDRIVSELNGKLPMSTQYIRLDRVEYSGRTLRYHGTLLTGHEFTEQLQGVVRGQLQATYCGHDALKKRQVGVEYAFTQIGIQNINDKVQAKDFRIAVGPENCT